MLQIVDRWLQWKTSKENAKLVSFCFLLVVSSSLLENELDSWFCFDTQMMCVWCVISAWNSRQIFKLFGCTYVYDMFNDCTKWAKIFVYIVLIHLLFGTNCRHLNFDVGLVKFGFHSKNKRHQPSKKEKLFFFFETHSQQSQNATGNKLHKLLFVGSYFYFSW